MTVEFEGFDVQVGSVNSLEPNIFYSAVRLANSAGTNLGYRQKWPLAGPNDIIYILANMEFWREVLPFAGKAIAGAIIGAAGQALWGQFFKSKLTRDVEALTDRQRAMIAALDELNSQIAKTSRYWQPNSEIRFGLPTTIGAHRGDVGFTIRDSERDPALAIMALNVIGPDVMEVVEERRKSNDGAVSKHVMGDIKIEEDGSVSAELNVHGTPIGIIRKSVSK